MRRRIRKNCSALAAAALLALIHSAAVAADENASVDSIIRDKSERFRSVIDGPEVIGVVLASKESLAALSEEEILERDREWRAARKVSPLMLELMRNDCALRLMQLQEDDDSFSEIFVTGESGVNVCQTNRTSDYLQSDEDWWQDAYASGAGRDSLGRIQFDESAGVESISIALPIRKDGVVVGIAKAVIDITSVKRAIDLGREIRD